MSIEAVTLVMYGLRDDVSPAQKLIMMILAEHARRGSPIAWPRVEKIADLACLKRRQVQELLRELTNAGWLAVIGSGKGGHALSTHYGLNVERLVERAIPYVETKVNNDAERRALIGALRRAVTQCGQVPARVQFSTPNGAPERKNGAVDGVTTVRPSAPEPVLNLYKTGLEHDAQMLKRFKSKNLNQCPVDQAKNCHSGLNVREIFAELRAKTGRSGVPPTFKR